MLLSYFFYRRSIFNDPSLFFCKTTVLMIFNITLFAWQILVSYILKPILWSISDISSPTYAISYADILSTPVDFPCFSEYIALTTSSLKILSSLSSSSCCSSIVCKTFVSPLDTQLYNYCQYSIYLLIICVSSLKTK